MRSAQQTLDDMFLEMRWRCLSLAADLDRVQRASGSQIILDGDERLKTLHQAMQILLSNDPNRAEQVQKIFSDS